MAGKVEPVADMFMWRGGSTCGEVAQHGGTNLESRSVPLQNSREAPCSNAFSSILYPKESSVFVADSLLEPVAERL